jgi:hypothetical protein
LRVVTRSEGDIENYLGALDSLIDKMAGVPGDRLIVLLSPGIYVPARFRQTQNAIISRAIRAKVVISGVDVRGVHLKFPPGDDPTTATTRYGLGETEARGLLARVRVRPWLFARRGEV